MSQTHFFATRNDLLPVFAAAQKKQALRYVNTAISSNGDFESYSDGALIPTLGLATDGSSTGTNKFLVLESTADVKVRTINHSDGRRSFRMDQLLNNDSISFSPGGIWKPDIMIQGTLGTAYNGEVSAKLYRRFQYSLGKYFEKVGICLVGPEALELLKSGMRLTISEKSPPDYNLVLPPSSRPQM
jgi:hypothetical protein